MSLESDESQPSQTISHTFSTIADLRAGIGLSSDIKSPLNAGGTRRKVARDIIAHLHSVTGLNPDELILSQVHIGTLTRSRTPGELAISDFAAPNVISIMNTLDINANNPIVRYMSLAYFSDRARIQLRRDLRGIWKINNPAESGVRFEETRRKLEDGTEEIRTAADNREAKLKQLNDRVGRYLVYARSIKRAMGETRGEIGIWVAEPKQVEAGYPQQQEESFDRFLYILHSLYSIKQIAAGNSRRSREDNDVQELASAQKTRIIQTLKPTPGAPYRDRIEKAYAIVQEIRGQRR